jgi:hypothetical protein
LGARTGRKGLISGDDAPAVDPGGQDADDRLEQLATEVWRRLGRSAAYCAAGAFLKQSALFLLDATGAFARRVAFTTSGRGLDQDLIELYVRQSERMHGIWWNVAVRDVVGPLGYLALVVAVQAMVHMAGTTPPRQSLVGGFALSFGLPARLGCGSLPVCPAGASALPTSGERHE